MRALYQLRLEMAMDRQFPSHSFCLLLEDTEYKDCNWDKDLVRLSCALEPRTSRQSERRKSRIACLSLSESWLKRLMTVLASDGP